MGVRNDNLFFNKIQINNKVKETTKPLITVSLPPKVGTEEGKIDNVNNNTKIVVDPVYHNLFPYNNYSNNYHVVRNNPKVISNQIAHHSYNKTRFQYIVYATKCVEVLIEVYNHRDRNSNNTTNRWNTILNNKVGAAQIVMKVTVKIVENVYDNPKEQVIIITE